MKRCCAVRELGLMRWDDAFHLQGQLASQRKAGEIGDQILIVEHPHVVTMGRNGHEANLLASPEVLGRAGIAFHETDRGGDVTYHGPGQIVGYPIMDLRDWKRDVHEYVRAIEQMLIDTIADFDIAATRVKGMTGVWVEDPSQGLAKIAAIGVHISRWITTHGFAFNLDPELSYFQYIVPCGLTKPVTSLRRMGVQASWSEVAERIEAHFLQVFDFDLLAGARASVGNLTER